jgi:hypothetical protein
MEDGLQDVAIAIRDIGILPIGGDRVRRAIPVPEAQRASSRRYRELLVKGAITQSFVVRIETAEAIGCVAYESGEGSRVRLHGRYHRGRVLV